MSGNVLVVDDDEDIREGIVDALRDEGYHVAEAWNGEDALAKLSGLGVLSEASGCVSVLPMAEALARLEQAWARLLRSQT